MISPTIGRVVLFRHSAAQGDPYPAFVTKVWTDNCINVAGFNDGGTQFSANSLRLIQDDEAPPSTGPYTEWMPYQKAQAAKHEQPAPPPVDNAFVAPGCEQFGESSGPVSA